MSQSRLVPLSTGSWCGMWEGTEGHSTGKKSTCVLPPLYNAPPWCVGRNGGGRGTWTGYRACSLGFSSWKRPSSDRGGGGHFFLSLPLILFWRPWVGTGRVYYGNQCVAHSLATPPALVSQGEEVGVRAAKKKKKKRPGGGKEALRYAGSKPNRPPHTSQESCLHASNTSGSSCS